MDRDKHSSTQMRIIHRHKINRLLSLWLVHKLVDYFMVLHSWQSKLTHFACWMGGL